MPVEETCTRRARGDRDRQPRRAAGVAVAAPEVDAQARLRQRRALPRALSTPRAFAPDDLRTLGDLARFPFTIKTDLRDHYPFGMFAVPREQVVRIHASSGTTGTADGRRLHREGHRHLGHGHGALDPRRRRARRRHRARRVRLWPVHRRARRALRRRKTRLHRDPHVRRHDRASSAAHRRFQARHHHGDAVVHAGDRRGNGKAAHRSAADFAQDRHFRRRALDAGDAAGHRSKARHGCDRHLRPLGDHGARRRAGVHRDQGRIDDLGRSLLSGDRRPANRRGGCRRRERRAGLHLAHQGSVADDSLPHARPDALAAAERAVDAPHGKNHRPLRRHADHPRRQRLSDAGRGSDPETAGAHAALSARNHAAGRASTR